MLRDRLTALPDPRDRRGRRHSLVSVLLTASCAVLAGARSYLAIGQWARHAPQHTTPSPGGSAYAPTDRLGSALRRPPPPFAASWSHGARPHLLGDLFEFPGLGGDVGGVLLDRGEGGAGEIVAHRCGGGPVAGVQVVADGLAVGGGPVVPSGARCRREHGLVGVTEVEDLDQHRVLHLLGNGEVHDRELLHRVQQSRLAGGRQLGRLSEGGHGHCRGGCGYHGGGRGHRGGGRAEYGGGGDRRGESAASDI
ncbi:transposase family protein [Streptomyces sp. NPDC058637]|uniref:transposase family protein n=1 Tax=Streptomyces sp. NPDC058637 TaxID=3346569 RepID=UPI00365BFFCD